MNSSCDSSDTEPHHSKPRLKRQFQTSSSNSCSDSDTKNATEHQLQNIKPCCDCKNCNYWSTSVDWCGTPDLDTQKSHKKVIKKKFQPIFKAGKSSAKQIIRYNFDNCSKIEKESSFTKVLVHSDNVIPNPIQKVADAYFHPKIQESLRSLNYIYSVPLQSFAWPAIFRQLDVFLISGKRGGKTMSYLPAMCSFALEKYDKYDDLSKYKGPLIVVLCPNSEIGGEIFDLCLKLDCKQFNIHVSHLTSLYKYDKKEVDILITTPVILIECLKNRYFNLKRLCHLVFESCSNLLKTNEDNIYLLLNMCNEMLQHRVNNKRIQFIVSSRKWTTKLENMLKKLYVTPLVCIDDQLEAALYGKIDLELHFCYNNQKYEYILNVLNQSYLFKTIVVCKNSEIIELNKHLVRNGIKTICLSDQATKDQIMENEECWQTSISGQYPVFLCTDFILKQFLTIDDCMYLVHYSLPTQWSQFIYRFSCMHRNIQSPLISLADSEINQTKSFLIVDESNEKQISKINNLFSRFNRNLPIKLKNFIKTTKQKDEEKKVKNKVDLCPKLKLFGTCKDFCATKRHLITCSDIDTNLPQNGKIIFKILAIKDVSCFMVQLIRNIHLNGTITEICDDNVYDVLQFEENDTKTPVINVERGEFYAHCEYDKKGAFFVLCQVLQIENSKFVEVMLVPTGQKLQTMPSKLYQLPKKLKIVEMYVCNLIPPFQDEFYSERAFQKMLQKLQKLNYKNLTLSGDIHLQLNKTIWINNVMEKSMVNNVEVTKFNLKYVLLKQLKEVAEINPNQMNSLYRLAIKAGINLPNYKTSQNCKSTKDVIKPQWAFLDNNNISEVIFSAGISPDEFYLRLEKFQSLLENLEKDLQKAIKYDISDKRIDVEIGQYYAAPDAQQNYARILVLNKLKNDILCFYVDYGDEGVVNIADVRPLPQKFIAKLPFQAIRCRLHGIKPIGNNSEWEDKATDILYSFLLEPGTDYYQTLYTKIIHKEKCEQNTNEFVYTILLKDENVLINKVLVDEGLAQKIEEFDDFSIEECNSNEENTDDLDLSGFQVEILDCNKLMELWFPKQNQAIMEPQPQIENIPEPLTIERTCGEEYETGCLIPDVVWTQTEDKIKLKIKLIGVTDYKVNITRQIVFRFWTKLDGKEYELKLFLLKFAKLDHHSAKGQEVVVNLSKLQPGEWEQLTATKKRLRNIHYEVPEEQIENVKEPILTLGSDDEDSKTDPDDDNFLIYEIDDPDSDLEMGLKDDDDESENDS